MAVGPWVQEPDYDISVSWSRLSANRVLEGQYGVKDVEPQFEFFSAAQEGSFPVLPYDRMPVMLGDLWSGSPFSTFSNTAGYNTMAYNAGGFTFPGPIYNATSRVSVAASVVPLQPGRPSSGASGVAPFYFWPGEGSGEPVPWPDGADIEFEGHPDGISQWLDVEIAPTTQFRGGVNMTGDRGGASVAGFITAVGVGSRINETIVGAFPTGGGDTGMSVDQAPFSAPLPISLELAPGAPIGPDWPWLWAWTEMFARPAELPDGTAGNWTWQYGWAFNTLRLTWTVRPPRYRFIFETTSTPYRRNYPRHDSLAGGAARNFPASRAVQTSNRTSGGYL